MLARHRLGALLRQSGLDKARLFGIYTLENPPEPAKTDMRPGDAAISSGIPDDILQRKVLIMAPTRTPSQQGIAKTLEGNWNAWRIAFPTMDAWENPLMGWTSSADPMEYTGRALLQFSSKESAIAYCEKYGFKYEVQEPQMRRKTRNPRFSGYGDNFSVKRAGVPDLSYLPSNQSGGAASQSNNKQSTAQSDKQSAAKADQAPAGKSDKQAASKGDKPSAKAAKSEKTKEKSS